MPTPVAGHTLRLNAADTDHLWKEAAMTNHPANGEEVVAWDDEGDVVDSAFIDTTGPTYVASGIAGFGSLDFNGTDQALHGRNDADSADRIIDQYFAAGAKTLFVAFRVASIGTTAAAWYNNDGIFCDDAGFFGLHLRTSGGQPKLMAGNYDGNDDQVEIDIALDTDYVAMIRHDSGTMYLSVNGGAESSAATGNTQSLNGDAWVGKGAFVNAFFDGMIGEIILYETALTGTDLSDTLQFMTDKWLLGIDGEGGGGGGGNAFPALSVAI